MLSNKTFLFLPVKFVSKKIAGNDKLFAVSRNCLSPLLMALVLFISIANTACAQPAQPSNPAPGPLAYTFTLTNAAITSAGVYAPDSTLVRTLFSAVSRQAGTYRIEWDGKDDLGNAVPSGNYTVKVLSNNVKYTWQGIVGNTSTYNNGSAVHRGYYYCMTGMTVVNNYAYISKGYSEGSPSVSKFLLSKPQEKINIEPYTTFTANTDFVVNDGKIIYWAGVDPFNVNNTWVWGTNVSDDSNVNFLKGVSFKPTYARQYNAINLVKQANSLITGLAVQQKGNFLFVSRGGLNSLYVINKATGNVVQTVSVNTPGALCTDVSGNLWVVSQSNILKYKVNPNGTLSSPLVTISSVVQPIALAISPDNFTLAVADGGIASQQVKAFNNLTGKPLWTLGTPGGYMQDASVNNNKFYFNDVRGTMYPNGEPGFREFIAFQPDGSFWVNDPGNFRAQHYSANRTFIETIMSMGASYSTWADKNDNTRVGAEYLEFKIDNTQPVSGNTGWKLVNNWGANVSSRYDKTTKFWNVITLTSGGTSRTFGFLRLVGTNLHEIVEFQKNGVLRFTGIKKTHCTIDKDGSMLTDNLIRFAFQGFDSSNNPIWSGSPQILASTAIIQDRGPLPTSGFRNPYITSTNKIIFYAYGINLTNVPVTINSSFHLAAMQMGTNNYLWKTGQATHLNYRGAFPDAAHFDIGNKVNNYAGSAAMVSGQNVITGYHGEFWKGSQTNMYNHYWDNGLAVGQFGTVGPYNTESPAMMAGNALTPQLVNGDISDELYLWHGDESYHGGMHKWKISGLSTIQEQDIPVTYPSPQLTPVTPPGSNLMVGLPYDSPLQNNTAGWTITTSLFQQGWSIKTNSMVSDPKSSPDIYFSGNSPKGFLSINRDLGNNSKLTSWAITGQISYYSADQGGNMQQYVDVLDSRGKIIARLTNTFLFLGGPAKNKNTIYGNNKMLVSGADTTIKPLKWKLQPLVISAVNNLVTIQYAGYTVTASPYDPTANISAPATLRAYCAGGFNPTGRNFDFKDMRFINSMTDQVITFNPVAGMSVTNPTATLTAYSTSDLPVIFSVVSGPATVSGNKITVTGTGTVVVMAAQPGNYAYNAATSVTQSFTVGSQNTAARTDL